VYSLADSERVKVNLFVIGHRALRDDSVGRVFQRHRSDSLLLFANHSFTHAGGHYRAYYDSPAAVLKDFDYNRDMLTLNNVIARLPGRNYWRVGHSKADDIVNGKEAADSLAAHGYRVFGWDVEWKWDSLHHRTAGDMLDKVEQIVLNKRTFTPGNIVILFHDGEFEDPTFREEVRAFVRLVKSRSNYRITHLTLYPGSEGTQKCQPTLTDTSGVKRRG
jgi:hypothetical protein